VSADGTELDVLAIGAHPDDVELGCGGTLATLVAAGRAVGIVHLTGGEGGTRGTPEERRSEAHRAAEVLGATALEILDCGDGELRTATAEQDAVIALLRRYRPDLVLGPAPTDRHPDHERAFHLVREACYYAGLASRGAGARPHRPAAMFCYMQHDPFEPSFVVDVTAGWERKLAALAEYRSQLYQPGVERVEPPTKVASRDYFEAVVGRARHFGLMIGAAYGEPFWSRLPPAVDDPLRLLPNGLR
jgi:bacillithiol biosynthesis deacetylase BshB1